MKFTLHNLNILLLGITVMIGSGAQASSKDIETISKVIEIGIDPIKWADYNVEREKLADYNFRFNACKNHLHSVEFDVREDCQNKDKNKWPKILGIGVNSARPGTHFIRGREAQIDCSIAVQYQCVEAKDLFNNQKKCQ